MTHSKNYLILDFETKDPYISLGLGAGWVFGINVPTHLFKVLGFSFAFYDDKTGELEDLQYVAVKDNAYETLRYLLLQTQHRLIAHNSTYELGCLRSLGFSKEEIDQIIVYDTVIMAKLFDNTLLGYDLESLSKLFLNKDQRKNTDLLIDKVIELKLVPEPKRAGYNVDNFRRKCKQFAYQNLDVLQEQAYETVADYCNADIIATGQLFKYFIKHGLELKQAAYWSNIQKVCVDLRSKGLRINLDALNKGITLLSPEVIRLREEFYRLYPLTNKEFDLDSPKQLTVALKEAGYKLPKSEKGNDSTNAKWLEQNEDDPLIKAILDYRTAKKILNDFFIKLKDMQQYTCPEALVDGAKYGRIFPEYNLFGAVVTGRFSSSNPNIQQIPKGGEYGNLIRSIFVPNEDDNKFYSADWKQQEPRLQVHYANLINAPGAKEMVDKYKENPELDMHQTVADMASITKDEAKPINLGLVYGMGFYSLMSRLGLKKDKAEAILDRYHKAVPYVKQLINRCSNNFKKNKYIFTLDKRKLRRRSEDYDYKAISGLIQGSGADMMYKALVKCYEENIKVLAVIHDEICFEGNEQDAEKVRHIMCNTHETLTVPMLVDMKSGKSWGELTK
jgi:DNA polymerase I-like protein with 3'-5' exonuclease and polymerase domains